MTDDPIDPARPADATGPTGPADATGPAGPADATGPARSADAADATGQVGPADAADAAAAADRTDGSEAADGVVQPPLPAAIEAIMLVVDEPVAAVTLAQVLERPTGEVSGVLAELAAEYTATGRGFDLREVAGGWRLYTRDVCAPVVERFVSGDAQVRLTRAALETLAVVAYRQPVSRARVSAVRGVNCDGVMRTLVQRGLVEQAGTDEESGAHLYRTTGYFLERLGLRDLGELPELAPYLPDDIDDLEEMDQ